MTATVVTLPVPDPDAHRLVDRSAEGCGGVLEQRGHDVRYAGLCVVCGRGTIHRHGPSGMPACRDASIPQSSITAAIQSEARTFNARVYEQAPALLGVVWG